MSNAPTVSGNGIRSGGIRKMASAPAVSEKRVHRACIIRKNDVIQLLYEGLQWGENFFNQQADADKNKS